MNPGGYALELGENIKITYGISGMKYLVENCLKVLTILKKSQI